MVTYILSSTGGHALTGQVLSLMNHPYQQLPQFPPSTSIVTNQIILLLYVMLFPGRAQEEILQSILRARFQIQSVLYEKNNLLVLNARVMLLEWGSS
jgi:hypothetical protein